MLSWIALGHLSRKRETEQTHANTKSVRASGVLGEGTSGKQKLEEARRKTAKKEHRS